VDGAARSPFLGARALLLLTDLCRKSGPQPGVLASAFRLTPAEARLCPEQGESQAEAGAESKSKSWYIPQSDEILYLLSRRVME
jgi:hypothetical protein